MKRMSPNDKILQASRDLLAIERQPLPVFLISGADAERYLHGRITQNVKGLRPGAGAWSLVLSPQGRIFGQFILARVTGGFLLVSDPIPDENELLAAILQFRVSDDVQVQSLSANYRVKQVFGSKRETLIGSFENSFVFESKLGELSSTFVVTPLAAGFNLPPEVPCAGEDFYQLLRLKAGIPQFGPDLNEKVLGPETEVTDLVSFNKGCYAGQEVVEMATARGRPNRRFVRFQISGDTSECAAGTEVKNAEGAVSGVITSCIYSPENGKSYGLALLKTSAIDSGTAFSASGKPLDLS